jgi:hypothetical protein
MIEIIQFHELSGSLIERIGTSDTWLVPDPMLPALLCDIPARRHFVNSQIVKGR